MSRSPRRWVILGLSLLIVGVGVQYVMKTSEPDPHHPDQVGTRSAFLRWRQQLQGFWQMEDVYQKYNYPNAPVMGLILSPLAYLPKVHVLDRDIDLGGLSWFLLKVGMTAITFFLSVRLIENPGRPFPAAGQLAMLLLSLRPIIGDLSHGNVNLLILFLVVAALYAYRRGWDAMSGLGLALAITCKVTPALFVPYFLMRRSWKTVAWCLVGLVLFFLIVPGMALGQAHNWELLTSWMHNMILPYVVGGEVTTEHCNQSLPGMLYRLLTHSPSFLEDGNQPVGYYNLATLDPNVVRWLLKAAGVAFLGLLWWICRKPIKARADWRLAIEYAIVVLGMLLFSERTWKHHCVTMLLPFGVLCYYLCVIRPSAGRSAAVIVSIVLAQLLMASTSTSLWGGDAFGFKMGAKLAQVYGAYVWAELILLAASVFVWRQARSEAVPVEEDAKEPSARAISWRTV